MVPPHLRGIRLWLLTGCVLIALMVTIGGITRLTGSGLSITEWDVIMGTLPPLSEAGWQEHFARYQATPQYQQVNTHFGLSEFKQIFWWEYIHRLLGRALGLVFLIPFFFFLLRKRFDRRLRNRVLLIFALGAFQGILGWFMVASGLVDRPSVSHYRLAAHLLTALVTFGVTLWVALSLSEAPPDRGPPGLPRAITLFLLLLGVQITWGAFTAGLRAGGMFNTFPQMGGSLIPPGLWTGSPVWLNLTQNPVTVQFVHRVLAWIVLAAGLGCAWQLRLQGRRSRALLLGGAVLLQFVLGVLTILRFPASPVFWGTIHQAGALLLLTAGILARHAVREIAMNVDRLPMGACASRPSRSHDLIPDPTE